MFTVLSKTPKSRLYLIVALAILSTALLSFVAAPPIRLHHAASPDAISSSYDQVELVRAARYVAVAAQQAYLDQRRDKWTAGELDYVQPPSRNFRQAEQTAAIADRERAHQEYRRGKWSGK